MTHKYPNVNATIKLIRAMGLYATCNLGEFEIDYRKADPRHTAQSSYFTTSRHEALFTARTMAEWQISTK